MNTKTLVAAAFVVSLIGCVGTQPASKLNELSLGMSKAEVIAAIGSPDTTRAADGVEYLIYELQGRVTGGQKASCGLATVFTWGMAAGVCANINLDDYFVKIEDGVVASYGRVG